jgi:two-component system NtrC family sensor kinase
MKDRMEQLRTKNVRAPLRSKSLRWRIVTLLLLVSLVPLALVGLGSWVVFGSLLVEKTLEKHRQMVMGHASAIELYLAERVRALEMVARSHSRQGITNGDELQRIFDALSASYPRAFVDLGVIGDDGIHLAYVGPYDLKHKNYADTEWFQTVRTRGSYISDVFLGYRQVPHCIIAVQRKEGQRDWILRATLNSDDFYSLVRAEQIGKTGDAFIVDTRGFYQTPPRLGKVLQPSPVLSPEMHKGVRDHRAVMKGRPVLRVTSWLNEHRWMLVVQQDEGEIKAPVNRAMGWGVLVILIAVGLVAVTTFLATWHLTNRIDRVTAQREAMQRDLIRSAKLASLGEMSSGLAHEINNPLAIISATVTNISDHLDDLELDDGVRAELTEETQRCKRQVERCSGITAKMLRFGRNTETAIQKTDIAPVVQETVRAMQTQARVRNIDLQLDLEPDLPPVLLDSTELEQVLANLINNSMYSINGHGSITVAARKEDQAIELSVQDDGCGIAPEDQERIFQPFFTTKPVGEGTGLGLSVCYGIVSNWGGEIAAQSAMGSGTVITIRLPSEADENRGDKRRNHGQRQN